MPAIANSPVPRSAPSIAQSPSNAAANPLLHTLALVLRSIRWTIYASALILLVLLLHKAAPPPVTATPEAAARVEQKFQDVQQAVSQGQPATLRMDETELNSYLASHLQLAGNSPALVPLDSRAGAAPPSADPIEQTRSNVKDVKVQLEGDRVKAYVVFNVHGKDMTLQLEGKLGADNGFLKFQPVSGHIGALPIPQATLQAAVRRLMDSPENREKLKLPDDVSDLKIENGEVVAQYQ